MKISREEYAALVREKTPPSPLGGNLLRAFLIGGLICVIGQILVNLYQQTGLSLQDARCAVSVTLVGLSAILTALHVYDNIAKVAGAGTLVPITGFANAVVSPAIEFKAEGFIMGIGAKMFVIAGPVLVYGITASVIYGIIVYVFGLY